MTDIYYPSEEEIHLFLVQSNIIEDVYGSQPLEDSIRAWNYVVTHDHMTVDVVLHIHRLVMKRLAPRIAGRFRECDVWVGGNHKKFTNRKVLLDRVKAILTLIDNSIYGENKKDLPSDYAKRCHVTFEDIHPFEDGNGRVGRIIYNWHRLKLGQKLHIIHSGAEQKEYYTWFKDKNLWV